MSVASFNSDKSRLPFTQFIRSSASVAVPARQRDVYLHQPRWRESASPRLQNWRQHGAATLQNLRRTDFTSPRLVRHGLDILALGLDVAAIVALVCVHPMVVGYGLGAIAIALHLGAHAPEMVQAVPGSWQSTWFRRALLLAGAASLLYCLLGVLFVSMPPAGLGILIGGHLLVGLAAMTLLHKNRHQGEVYAQHVARGKLLASCKAAAACVTASLGDAWRLAFHATPSVPAPVPPSGSTR